jgi:hypothetical protein
MNLTEQQINALIQAIMTESKAAWEAGSQNVPGPISREAAAELVLRALCEN